MENEEAKQGEIILYQTDDGRVKLDVRLQNESLWLTQSDMAQLFQCSSDNVSLHLKNIYEEGELEQSATIEDFSVVRKEGEREVQRRLTFYNLDAVISVGYRVKSLIATRFRIWATQRLREYVIKGFVMDEGLNLSSPRGGGLNVAVVFQPTERNQQQKFASRQRPHEYYGEHIFTLL